VIWQSKRGREDEDEIYLIVAMHDITRKRGGLLRGNLRIIFIFLILPFLKLRED
jgi:hypothetical protein